MWNAVAQKQEVGRHRFHVLLINDHRVKFEDWTGLYTILCI